MKLLQRAILVVFGVGVFFAGIILAVMPLTRLAELSARLPIGDMWRIVIGLVMAAVALFAVLPIGGLRRGKRITFPSPQGNVSLQLDSVEAALRKSLKKLSAVNKVSIDINADDKSRKVRIGANVLLNKAVGASAREASIRLSDEIARQARQLLGSDEVSTVDLNIDGIVVDGKDLAAEPIDIYSNSVKDSLPTGRSETAQPAASAARVVAAAPAVAAAATPVAENATSGWEAPAKEETAPLSDDLVSYEESLKLRQDEEPEEDPLDMPLRPDMAGAKGSKDTSFDSLSDETSESEKEAEGPSASQ